MTYLGGGSPARTETVTADGTGTVEPLTVLTEYDTSHGAILDKYIFLINDPDTGGTAHAMSCLCFIPVEEGIGTVHVHLSSRDHIDILEGFNILGSEIQVTASGMVPNADYLVVATRLMGPPA